jgi:hypothetical protein
VLVLVHLVTAHQHHHEHEGLHRACVSDMFSRRFGMTRRGPAFIDR